MNRITCLAILFIRKHKLVALSRLLQNCSQPFCECHHRGGAEEDRTPDLLHAKQVLSQLSYGPIKKQHTALSFGGSGWI